MSDVAVGSAPVSAPPPGVAHLAIRVTDFDTSIAWFASTLGFESEVTNGYAFLRGSEWNVVLVLIPAAGPLEPSNTSSQRLDHVALHVPSLVLLERWRDRIAAVAGVAPDLHPSPLGASVTLHDPDGLEVELFCPAPDSPLLVR